MGDEDAVNIDSAFQSMKAVERTSAKLRTCDRDCRVLERLEPERKGSMVVGRWWLLLSCDAVFGGAG